MFSVSVLLELPVPVVEGADLPGLQPAGDAVEVEGVVTHPPGHGTLLASGAGLARVTSLTDHLLDQVSPYLVGLALDAQVHDVVPADGAVVHHDVPGPESHSVPLLHLESLLILSKKILYSHQHQHVTSNFDSYL